jgi:transposase-like protein
MSACKREQIVDGAQRSPSKGIAKRHLTQLIKRLEDDYPGAAASLKEHRRDALAEVPQPPQALERTLSTTNPIEDLNDSIRRVQRSVKR